LHPDDDINQLLLVSQQWENCRQNSFSKRQNDLTFRKKYSV